MATEQQQQQQQPAVTVLGRPREPPRQPSPTLGASAAAGGGADPSHSQTHLVEVRDYEFFAQRDFNELKDASRAYFAGKTGNPSSWLGDATPPASAHPSLDESRPVPGEFSYQSSEKESSNRKILGLHRLWFWTLLAIIAVIIVVAIGVGVGLGTTRAANGSKNANGAGPASDASSTATGTGPASTNGIAVTTTAASPTLTQAPTTTSSSSQVSTASPGSCPDINGTVYAVPGSTKQFLQLCGIDYGKQDGAVDIRNVYTDTAEDCMDNCAGTAGCTGCGWGFIEGDSGPSHRCWLKEDVTKKPHTADMTWHFGVLL
ncbi:hypothetical protein GGS24DRAFT_506769 [Hypoxylon argillaceum]|nr:hypothetical protein GGS24DRAFT_506769 [Hypoxylon argillaceum]